MLILRVHVHLMKIGRTAIEVGMRAKNVIQMEICWIAVRVVLSMDLRLMEPRLQFFQVQVQDQVHRVL